MVTERLYYLDAYVNTFRARVRIHGRVDGRPAVALDRTAFFPESGGQPADSGTLNGIPVLGLHDDGDLVWHLLEAGIDQEEVEGRLDWQKRRDHMQNHSGQHILSQAFVETANATTVAWHLSPNSVTIDLDSAGLSEDDLERAEQLANAVVQEDRPITARLVTENELPALALRKVPDVDGPLRIVEIADFDRIACSGTHVRATAQVGLIKITRVERRGAETRVHFVCGARALADYGRKHALVRALARRFTRAEEELLDAVDKLDQEAQATRRRLKVVQGALVDAEAERLLARARAPQGHGFIGRVYADWDPEDVRRLASAVRQEPGLFVALAGGDPPRLFFAAGEGSNVDAGKVLKAALTAVDGRGGGRPDFAQGSAPSLTAAETAIEMAAALAHKPTVDRA